MGRHSEDRLQMSLNNRLKELEKIPDFKPHLEWLFHVENETGGTATPQQMERSRLMGVKSGVSDLVHPLGFYIELKRPGKGGRTSDQQKKFIAYCQSIGTPILLTNDIDEAEYFVIDQIAKFLGNYRVTKIPPTKLIINGWQTMDFHSVWIERIA